MESVFKRRVVPAKVWFELNKAYSVNAYTSNRCNEQEPPPIRARRYEGALYTVCGAVYQRWASDQDTAYFDAYPLLPPDSVNLIPRRYSYEGRRVSYQGKNWVCGPAVRFLRALPSRALPLAEAQAHDRKMRHRGWRSLHFDSPEITWHELQGHPVVLYQEGNRARAELNWRRPDGIIDFIPIAVEALERAGDTEQKHPVQPGLF